MRRTGKTFDPHVLLGADMRGNEMQILDRIESAYEYAKHLYNWSLGEIKMPTRQHNEIKRIHDLLKDEMADRMKMTVDSIEEQRKDTDNNVHIILPTPREKELELENENFAGAISAYQYVIRQMMVDAKT